MVEQKHTNSNVFDSKWILTFEIKNPEAYNICRQDMSVHAVTPNYIPAGS